ncbi:MAG: hypothetical protein RLN76_11600 [Phycisphaeraceae bacterium]
MERKIIRTLATLGIALACSAPAFAGAEQTNGMNIQERVFNDFPGTSLTTTNNFPSLVQFAESGYTGAGFANRHDAMASTDGGATEAQFDLTDGFSISANVTLEVGSVAPRKEAGIRVNSGISGDALFLINSDAGEIVAFGGGAPFYIFSGSYTPGDTIFMQMNYTPSGTFGVPGKVEYVIERGAGLESSGLLDWSNLEGGPLQYNVGFYGQFSPDIQNTAEFATATFADIRIVPEPAAASLLALGALALTRRRVIA